MTVLNSLHVIVIIIGTVHNRPHSLIACVIYAIKAVFCNFFTRFLLFLSSSHKERYSSSCQNNNLGSLGMLTKQNVDCTYSPYFK